MKDSGPISPSKLLVKSHNPPVVLWFAGALIGRYQIARYYAAHEGSNLYLSLAFTLLFGVWYLNYRFRPEFPNEARVGPGV
jgi:hypothetical protein